MPPAPPLLRDPWALATVLAVLVVVVRAWGAPLGEPVAEDFDFLQRALFGTLTLLDGGGSTAFWRPIPHQLYYLAFARVMLEHPAVIAGIHAALLALASLLFYRALRTVRPGPWAAVVATAPLLSESTRLMIAFPSDFVDVSLWLFVALAVHETARRRLPTALLALLCALLCKEVAVIAAVLLPLMPGIGPRDKHTRLRWLAACCTLTAAWGVVYLAVRAHAHLAMPHAMEQTMATATWGDRLGWATTNSLRALVSLPLAGGPNDRWVGTLLALFVLVWAALALRHARDRARWRRVIPWTLWGVAWFLAATAPLTTVFPFWMPNRSAFGSLGIAAATAELAATAHPALLAGLVVVRLMALGVAPAPPVEIAYDEPKTGAFLDFEHLTRLQRLMRATRLALHARMPQAAHGARVGTHYMPRHAQYAFGGHNAIRAWYRDSTLDWVTTGLQWSHPESALTTIVEFEPETRPQIGLVEPDAMRAYLASIERMQASDWTGAGMLLDRAQGLQLDDAARVFRGFVAGERARVLFAAVRFDDADRQAEIAIRLYRKNIPAHYVLGCTALMRGQLNQAAMHVDSVLQWLPNDAGTLKLREAVLRAARAAQAAH